MTRKILVSIFIVMFTIGFSTATAIALPPKYCTPEKLKQGLLTGPAAQNIYSEDYAGMDLSIEKNRLKFITQEYFWSMVEGYNEEYVGDTLDILPKEYLEILKEGGGGYGKLSFLVFYPVIIDALEMDLKKNKDKMTPQEREGKQSAITMIKSYCQNSINNYINGLSEKTPVPNEELARKTLEKDMEKLSRYVKNDSRYERLLLN